MKHATPSAVLNRADVARLDQLLAKIADSHDTQTEVLVVHLQSARVYLLGAMADEYEFSLMAAKGAATELSNSDLGEAVIQEAQVLLDHVAKARPGPE